MLKSPGHDVGGHAFAHFHFFTPYKCATVRVLPRSLGATQCPLAFFTTEPTWSLHYTRLTCHSVMSVISCFSLLLLFITRFTEDFKKRKFLLVALCCCSLTDFCPYSSAEEWNFLSRLTANMQRFLLLTALAVVGKVAGRYRPVAFFPSSVQGPLCELREKPECSKN